jgi:hypothetical protein
MPGTVVEVLVAGRLMVMSSTGLALHGMAYCPHRV